MRLGSGSERRRCIMQFSLAAGSDSAGDDSSNIYHIYAECTHGLHLSLSEASGELPQR